MELLGVPPPGVLKKAKKWDKFFDAKGRPKDLKDKKGRYKCPLSKSLNDLLKTSDDYFIDFIEKCLTWEAENRLTPEAALEHPWVLDALKKTNGAVPASLSNNYA